MIGYVISGAAAGLTGGVTHLATGGSPLMALGIYAGIGTAGILGLATRAAFAPEHRGGTDFDQASRRTTTLGTQIRAGRPSLPQAQRSSSRTALTTRRDNAVRGRSAR